MLVIGNIYHYCVVLLLIINSIVINIIYSNDTAKTKNKSITTLDVEKDILESFKQGLILGISDRDFITKAMSNSKNPKKFIDIYAEKNIKNRK